MKTINIKIIMIAAALFALLPSCINLEREDSTAVQYENFLKTEEDMKLYVYSLYRPFCSSNGGAETWGFYATLDAGYYALTEYTTDILCSHKVEGNDGGRAVLAMRHAWDLTSNQLTTPLFQKYFPKLTHISVARMAYLRLKNLDLPNKDEYAAEALAIIGWTGMILYDMFGPLPIPTDEQLLFWNEYPLQGEWLPRPSKDEYLTYMIDCLEEAIPNLPETQSDWGRITKGAGRMLYLRLCLMKGDFERALPIARDLYKQGIESGEGSTYALNDSYKNIFQVDASSVKELILAIPCDGTKDYSPNQWYGQVMPSDYPKPSDAATASPGHRMRWAFYDTYEPGDKRLETIVSSYVNINGTLITREKLKTGALPFKYLPDPDMNGNFSKNDIPVFRYAEAILILAECEFECNGVTEEAIRLVNQVRTRAGLPGIETIDGGAKVASAEAFREAIFTERAHEMYCEGVRHMDLIRQSPEKWAEYGEKGLDAASLAVYNEDPRKYVFPIDPDIVLRSNGVIEQNEAYR